MTTPSLPAAVRDTIYEAVTDLKLERWFGDKQSEEMREMLIGSLTAALGPVWADAQKDADRLDWLDVNDCSARIHYFEGERHVYTVTDEQGRELGHRYLLRDAIDAARKEEDSIQ